MHRSTGREVRPSLLIKATTMAMKQKRTGKRAPKRARGDNTVLLLTEEAMEIAKETRAFVARMRQRYDPFLVHMMMMTALSADMQPEWLVEEEGATPPTKEQQDAANKYIQMLKRLHRAEN